MAKSLAHSRWFTHRTIFIVINAITSLTVVSTRNWSQVLQSKKVRKRTSELLSCVGGWRRKTKDSIKPPGVLPLHVWAQECDSQQKVHHDGAHHHSQSQENGQVLSPAFSAVTVFLLSRRSVVPDFGKYFLRLKIMQFA